MVTTVPTKHRITFRKGIQQPVEEVAEDRLAVRVSDRRVPRALRLEQAASCSILRGRHVAVVRENPVASRAAKQVDDKK